MIPRLERHALQNPGATIVPYPLARRRDLVTKIAAQMMARPIAAAERHLQQQVDRQFRILKRKGVPHADAQKQTLALQATVRAELWRLLMHPNSPPKPPKGAA